MGGTLANALSRKVVVPSTEGAPTIIVDFDATLWDINRAIATNIAGLECDTTYRHITSRWDAMDDVFTHDEKTAALEAVFGFEAMRDYLPFEGARECLENLRIFGVRVVVFTHRPASNIEQVATYLSHHSLPVSDIWCGFSCKIDEGLQHGAFMIVDDKPDTIETAHRNGLPAATLRWDYNAETVDRLGVFNAPSWTEGLSAHILNSVPR